MTGFELETNSYIGLWIQRIKESTYIQSTIDSCPDCDKLYERHIGEGGSTPNTETYKLFFDYTEV